jgi:hypothetical protein
MGPDSVAHGGYASTRWTVYRIEEWIFFILCKQIAGKKELIDRNINAIANFHCCYFGLGETHD